METRNYIYVLARKIQQYFILTNVTKKMSRRRKGLETVGDLNSSQGLQRSAPLPAFWNGYVDSSLADSGITEFNDRLGSEGDHTILRHSSHRVRMPGAGLSVMGTT